MQQCGKGKGKTSELLVYNWCMEHGLECKLGPGKLTLCMECHKMKVKCEQPGEETLERKCKQAQMEELKMEPSGLKRQKKTSEERSDRVMEVLRAGLKAIMDALSKQKRLLQELVELEVDKVELIQLDWWVLQDKEDEDEDETEEGEEVEVEKELPELAKEREENRDGLKEEEEAEE